ncbi:MAG: hypothetical protein H8E14_02635 [Candidatus Marinimicrobia bacterium]|nr:hypothetical protein [Candidatus Neomarinimicrobiota bacterium]
MKKLNKYSLGIGDRFAHQAVAQLEAIRLTAEKGKVITPVWNKSFREHEIIGSQPVNTRLAADSAVNQLNWLDSYFVDADHINLDSVGYFIDSCDFFTLDVSDYIDVNPDNEAVEEFLDYFAPFAKRTIFTKVGLDFNLTPDLIRKIADRYLYSIKQAGEIYRHIRDKKGTGNFITEVSIDETNLPQTPAELLIILAAIAFEKIPAATIAPKFTGRFNKGVDYVGDTVVFEREFEADLQVIKIGIELFGLPDNLKLSIHSGSDKFSIYPIMQKLIRKYNTGLHVKTAGTTWLEELIGLAEAGGEALEIAKDVYAQCYQQMDALKAPYSTVIDIDNKLLPSITGVNKWTGSRYAQVLRHDQANRNYNLHFRQLLHVGYKIAAQMGDRYLQVLEKYEPVIARNVTENLFKRHITPIFLAD